MTQIADAPHAGRDTGPISNGTETTKMVKVTTQAGTVTEITNTGSVTVETDDSLTQYVLITSDFPTMPRLNQRVTLETAFGHTAVSK